MTLKHPEYAHGISDAELIKEAIKFCDGELDAFDGMEYDSDSEVCCQRSNTFIRELVNRLRSSDGGQEVEELRREIASLEYRLDEANGHLLRLEAGL